MMDQQTWSHFRSSWLLITFELDVISYQPREGALDNYNNYYLTRVVIERTSFAHSLVLRLVCTMTMWLWISDGDDKNDWDHAIYVDDLYRIAWWWFLIVKLPLVRLLKVKNLLPEDRLRGRFQTESQREGSILVAPYLSIGWAQIIRLCPHLLLFLLIFISSKPTH